MKRAALLLLLIALPISAAEGVNVPLFGDTHCTMTTETMAKIINYIRALEQKVADMRATSGCS